MISRTTYIEFPDMSKIEKLIEVHNTRGIDNISLSGQHVPWAEDRGSGDHRVER
jgi:hypothetical protein